MKKNFPITGQERLFPDGVTLVSRTDTKGIITFANDGFVEVSGFSREELLGSSHNIVRHPDVPPVIFEDMWDTLKRNTPWRGVVKNRCKNGDHYWVDAHVVPVRKDGATIGYMSVRKKPERDAVAKAELAYAEAARTGHVERVHNDSGWRRFLSVKNGVALGIVFVTLMMIAGGILGITGLSASSAAMRGLYYEQMAPVQAIGRINFLMADNRAQISLALRRHGEGLQEQLATVVKNRAEIEQLWAEYGKLPRSGVERDLANRYWEARLRYVDGGLTPAQEALQRGDYATAEKALLGPLDARYDEANARAGDLLAFLSKRAQDDFMRVGERNETISMVAVAGISFGCLVLIFAGVYFFRATVMPLQAAVAALERIAEGNLSDDTDSSGYGEPGRVMSSVTVMRLHLQVMINEIKQSSSAIHAQCKRLNETMMNLAQHSEEQHDRVYQTVDAANAAGNGLGKLAQDTEAMMLLAEQDGVGEPRIAQLVEELSAAVRLQAFAMADTVIQMQQVASLIVENRGEVQGAWAASQQLEMAAQELDRMIKYFE